MVKFIQEYAPIGRAHWGRDRGSSSWVRSLRTKHSRVISRILRCCGSALCSSDWVIEKNEASKTARSSCRKYPYWVLIAPFLPRASPKASEFHRSGGMALRISLPLYNVSHRASSVWIPPGMRIAMPQMAIGSRMELQFASDFAIFFYRKSR